MKMCRKIPVCLLLIAMVLPLSACGKERPEATTVYAEKDGELKQILVDTAPDYTAGDLQEYTEKRITAYLDDAEDGEVRLNSCEEEDDVVYMELSFGSAADYAAFNSMDCFCGTLEEASEEGAVSADDLFAPDGSAADFSALLADHPDYHILVLAENVLVQTETEILCTNTQVTVTGEKTAMIGDGDAGTSGYFPRKTDASAVIIYK